MAHGHWQQAISTATSLAAGVALVGCGMAPLAPPAGPGAPSPLAAPGMPAPAPVQPALPEPFGPPEPSAQVLDAEPVDPVVPYPDPAPQPEVGLASWYGLPFHGRRTANGERYDMNAMTAAHPTLPLASFVHVRHLGNSREVVLRVNDRGPFKFGRIIDLSRAAARQLGITGLAQVEVLRLAKDDVRIAAADALSSKRLERPRQARMVKPAAQRARQAQAQPARRSVSASAARRSVRSG